MLEELKERNMELQEQISQLKLKLQAFENDQLRKMFIELTKAQFFSLFLSPRTRSDQAEELKTMERKLQELLESYGERSRYAHSWSN